MCSNFIFTSNFPVIFYLLYEIFLHISNYFARISHTKQTHQLVNFDIVFLLINFIIYYFNILQKFSYNLLPCNIHIYFRNHCMQILRLSENHMLYFSLCSLQRVIFGIICFFEYVYSICVNSN